MWFCRSIRHRLAPVGILILSICSPAPAQQKQAQQMDDDFAKSVKEWTTRPEFISPLVDHLPKVAGVPSPKEALGYHIGAPMKLTRTAEIYKYYRELASRSPRVKVINIGQTDEGRECLVVVVADEETVKNIDTYRGYLAQLGDPRRVTEVQAQEIIAKAKPIYHLMGGLHSAETGPPEMLMELTYRLAVEDAPIINAIRDNVIVTITPVAEPDGRDRYVDWYYRHKINETGEQDSMGGPPYWGKYIYHDNNRDINYSQVTMRNLLEWYLQWRPPIMHDLHESVPFMYTFSGQAPQQPALDPILYGELPWFSNFEMSQMIKYGMPGVWTHGFVDMWSPGYLAFMSSNHNGMIRMYETFGNGGANTMKRKVAQPDQAGASGQASRDQTSREWYRPSPPYKEVEWSMRNNTNFMETGALSALQLTSQFPKVVLENFYKKSRNSIEDGKTNAPYGFIIPAQANMTGVEFIVNTLRLQGIEVGRLTGEAQLKEGSFPAGSFVIKRDQPYGRLAKILLEKQNFPDQSLRTYDDTGWTMGLTANTPVIEIADKAVLNAPVAPVDRLEIKGEMKDRQGAAAYAVVNHGSNKLITLRFRLKDLKVQANELSFKAGDAEIPAGSFIIAANRPEAHDRVKAAVESLGLKAIALTSTPAAPTHEVDLPRLAVYSTWGSTQEVGWVRHALDKFEVNYDLIYKERVKQGNLREAYDVIVIPNQGRNGKGLVFDREPARKPLAYTKSDQFKSQGIYGESEDITGGMGLQGALEFQKFVEAGGLLVTLGQASFFPPEFGLTRKIEAGRPSPQFYAPGPVVEAEILQPSHPIFYGYAQKTVPVRYANGPLLTVPEPDREQQVLMRFPGSDKSVLSGLMRGVAEIRNRPAIVDVPTGKGRVILFATNPCYRWQNHGEFAMLFNSILHHNDIKTVEKKPAQTAEVK
ncbi:MAG TPA: M14 family zinc carboxypeptidase [Blastocatellia bacterium]|jgi:hypothetical protein|nr:M14 family zinc carboxypeptidase [Blastocatellia bacterium]